MVCTIDGITDALLMSTEGITAIGETDTTITTIHGIVEGIIIPPKGYIIHLISSTSNTINPNNINSISKSPNHMVKIESKGGFIMKSPELDQLTAKLPSKGKDRISAHIRKIDNGFVLSIDKDTSEGFENVELAITSLPKLLKALATFLKEETSEEE
jgi:hypothetical protein